MSSDICDIGKNADLERKEKHNQHKKLVTKLQLEAHVNRLIIYNEAIARCRLHFFKF